MQLQRQTCIYLHSYIYCIHAVVVMVAVVVGGSVGGCCGACGGEALLLLLPSSLIPDSYDLQLHNEGQMREGVLVVETVGAVESGGQL